jgi:glycosyltransferase involved in cell wall biosynthesis
MQARAELGIDPEERVILFPASPDRPEKRFDRARELAERTGARLITLGSVMPYSVPQWIQASDLVAIPSEREGFGLAALEALSCRVPVLSTPHGVAPAALEGVSGSLCAEWDLNTWTVAAERVFESPAQFDIADRLEQWTSDSCARDVLSAWQSALERV